MIEWPFRHKGWPHRGTERSLYAFCGGMLWTLTHDCYAGGRGFGKLWRWERARVMVVRLPGCVIPESFQLLQGSKNETPVAAMSFVFRVTSVRF